MLEPRVLRVRLDAFEARLRPHALDLDSGTNTAISAVSLWTNATGRSVARKPKLVKYRM